MRARLPRKVLATALGLTCLATSLLTSTAFAADPMFAPGIPAARQLAEAAAMRQTAAQEQTIRFSPGVFSYFVIAQGNTRVSVSALKKAGLSGLMGSVSHVYDDGNNRQVADNDVLQPGQIYSARFDRETLIDFRTLGVSQADASTALPFETGARTPVYSFGGSPDDGTKVVIIYDASYNTKRYKCWKDGKSGAWDGITDQAPGADNVKNAGVVRRGKTIYVKDEAGMTGQESVTVYAPAAPGQARQTVAWTSSYNSQRAAFAINVPADAAIGDYQIAIGQTRANYTTAYVVFDPSYANQALSAEEIRSYAYVDEDWQGIAADKDYLNHAFEGPSGTTVYGYRGDTTAESGANGGVFGQRVVEIAAHMHGATTRTTLDAAIHAYVVMGQRIYWTASQGYYGADNGTVNSFDKMLLGSIKAPGGVQTRDELDIVAAEKAALGLGWNDRLPQSYIFAAGQCFNYGTNLTAMLRALGIPSRTPYTANGAGWPGSFHVWAEAYLDQPAIHPVEEGWWKSSWYKFDANRQYNTTGTSQIAHIEGNIGPIVIDGYGDYLLNEYKKCNGISYRGAYNKNAAKCTDAGAGTHAGVMLKANTTASVTTSTSGIYQDVSQASTPWAIQDLFVPYNGPATAPTVSYVISSHHGYALNDSQAGTAGGNGLIADNTKENDLPALLPGVVQRTIVAGFGFSIYRVPVNGRSSVTVKMQEGADKARMFATFDRMIYSTGKRYELNYDAQSDANGVLTVAGANKSQIYLWIENKFSHSSPGVGQEVTWVSLLDDSAVGGGNPTASFTSTTSGLSANFDGSASSDPDGAIVSYAWDYGDNSSAGSGATSSHTYASAGSYTVKLTVTDNSNPPKTGTTSKQVTVSATSNQPPTASFTSTASNLNVNFDGSGSSDPDGSIASYTWDYGDNSSAGSGASSSHTYALAGTYTVKLTVTDNGNPALSNSKTQSVTVADGGDNVLQNGVAKTGLAAATGESLRYTLVVPAGASGLKFVTSGGNGDADLYVKFGSAPTTTSSDCKSDGSSNAETCTIATAQAGTYHVLVHAYAAFSGLSLTGSYNTGTVNQAPTASFSAASNGLTASFNGSGSSDPDGSITSYSWNYGDNTSAGSGVTSSHTYAIAGTYTVTLTVTDNGNPAKTGSSSKQVTVTGGGGGDCTGGTSYSGNLWGSGWTEYLPGFSGYTAAAGAQALCLSGPGGANFDLYLDQRQSSGQWLNVARSTGASANETVSHNGTAGTYRVRVVVVSGSGNYTLVIKKP